MSTFDFRTGAAPPPPPTGGSGAPAGVAPPPPRFRRRRRWPTIVAVILGLLLLLGPLLGLGAAAWGLSRLGRVDVSALSPPPADGEPTNWLLVGSDSRIPIQGDPDFVDNDFFGQDPGGQRADVMILVQFDPRRSGPLLVSLPRDLWVDIPASCWGTNRINAAFNGCEAEGISPADLTVRTVQSVTGLPIHHYAQIDFAGFQGMVDAVGGIDICFPNPTRDNNSGLYADPAGCYTLDGVMGLAYVRSRHYEEFIDGAWGETSAGDLNRIARQQQVLNQILDKATSVGKVPALPALAGAVGGAVQVDGTLGLTEAISVAWRLRGFSAEAIHATVPATGDTIGGLSVLVPTADADALWEALATGADLPATALPPA